MTVVGQSPGRRKSASAKCVFTGIVLAHDRLSVPHRVLLERMCLEERRTGNIVYEGEHLWTELGAQGRYELPFLGCYLTEKDGRLLFVAEQDGHPIALSLKPGAYETGTLSFEEALDDYEIQSFVYP